ncbi:hypothetical protein OG900_05305 [Streptomyces sp. NBC_00433]
MIKRLLVVLGAALLGLLPIAAVPAVASAQPARAAATAGPHTVTPLVEPSGCTTSVSWVTQGSNYFYGLGSVQCTSGRYKAKLVCRNNQTGTAYALYGTQAVNAPATASATCNTGNTAETVQAVADPLGTGLTGCVSWAEWVSEGSNHYYGRGSAQCDSGQYRVKIVCRNNQTGTAYVISGSGAVSAPATTSATCNTGNTAETIQAVPYPPSGGSAGCVSWADWVTQGSNHFYGQGNAQCDSGQYRVKIVCRNNQTGTAYVIYSGTVSAPATATTTCNTGNTAETVQAAAYPPPSGVTGCVTWTDWVTQGSNHFYGQGNAQCDSGQYHVEATCKNVLSGLTYVLPGYTVAAPSTSTVVCNTGDTVQSLVTRTP